LSSWFRFFGLVLAVLAWSYSRQWSAGVRPSQFTLRLGWRDAGFRLLRRWGETVDVECRHELRNPAMVDSAGDSDEGDRRSDL